VAPPYCDRDRAQALYQYPNIPINPAHRISSGVGQGGVKPLLSEKWIEHVYSKLSISTKPPKKFNIKRPNPDLKLKMTVPYYWKNVI
jgi:hypothetical protein